MRCTLLLAALLGVACVQCGPDRRAAPDDGMAANVGQQLQLDATPLQLDVDAEGPLLVEVTILNPSDSAIHFAPMFAFGEWLDAEITDSTGARLPRTAVIDGPNALPITLLKGEALTDTVDLRCSLEVSATPRGCMAAYDDLSHPGIYQVRMHFTLPCSGCREFVKIVAQPFTVRVREADPIVP